MWYYFVLVVAIFHEGVVCLPRDSVLIIIFVLVPANFATSVVVAPVATDRSRKDLLAD